MLKPWQHDRHCAESTERLRIAELELALRTAVRDEDEAKQESARLHKILAASTEEVERVCTQLKQEKEETLSEHLKLGQDISLV